MLTWSLTKTVTALISVLAGRKGVCLSTENMSAYICYADGEAVGNCDLFIHEDTAKIEDFDVAPKKQRQGYGTAILKFLIETALSKGASIIYLITDEEDTAKEMYLKYGFKKIGENVDLFFRIGEHKSR